jgi:4-hydroxybenzoate polyprenyltransferase
MLRARAPARTKRLMNHPSIPLCLALDGTLTPARTAHERLLALAKQSPAAFLWQLVRGRTSPQPHAPWSRSQIDVAALPLRRELVEWLRSERRAGRRLVLVADDDPLAAEQMALHLDLFDEVATTGDYRGSLAQRRRAALAARYGERGFDYAGSEASDSIVWDASRRAIVVGDLRVGKRIGRNTEVALVIPSEQASLRTWITAMRLHQWAKNGLIFVPAILAHAIFMPQVLLNAVLAFVAFGLCASSVYIVNDLFDLAADRQHSSKRHRPFAAGMLSVRSGLLVSLFLLIAAAASATAVGTRFVGVLAGYYGLTWAYSLILKRIPLLDVMMLAALYTLRVIAGSAATGIALSFWLLAFSVFIFLSLGFVKRYAELYDARKAGKLIGHARGYGETDLPLIMSLGTASGYCAIVVMALYINSPDSLSQYHHHKPLWLICPVMLFWISRIWIVTSRGAMHDDPLVFALRDRVSLLILGVLGAIMLVSI